MKNYTIKIITKNQFLCKLIYSLNFIKLKNLKINIKIYLKTGFI